MPAGVDPFGPGVAARYPDGLVPQGISAELIAAKWDLGRDASSTSSPPAATSAAAAAAAAGLFDRRDRAVTVPARTARRVVTRDEGDPPADHAEMLAGLRPAFAATSGPPRFPQIDWQVTAGNASPINDGAAAAADHDAARRRARARAAPAGAAALASRWPATTR